MEGVWSRLLGKWGLWRWQKGQAGPEPVPPWCDYALAAFPAGAAGSCGSENDDVAPSVVHIADSSLTSFWTASWKGR